MYTCPPQAPVCWFFPASCTRMFLPKSLLSLDSSLVNLCIQENVPKLFSWLSKSLWYAPSPLSESSTWCSKASIFFSRWTPLPIKWTQSSPVWPTLHNVCSFLAVFAKLSQCWKKTPVFMCDMQKSKVILQADSDPCGCHFSLSLLTFSFLFTLVLVSTFQTSLCKHQSLAGSDSEGLG